MDDPVAGGADHASGSDHDGSCIDVDRSEADARESLQDDGSSIGTDPAFRAALEAWQPATGSVLADPLDRGNRKRTAIVSTPEGAKAVIQLCDRDGALTAEAALLDAIRERTAVPVPTVLAWGTVDGTAYLVTDHVDGADLHERFTGLTSDVKRRLAGEFGRHLGALHGAFQFESYGRVELNEGSLQATGGDDWREWLRSYAREGIERLPDAFADLREPLFDAVSQPAVPASPTPRLYPWDFRPGNAIVDGEELAAVLDWERPLAAGRGLPVAKAEYLIADWYVDDPEPLRTAFREGYESRRPYPEITPTHRIAAVAHTAVDSAGVVTNPGYPEADRGESVAFHRRALSSALR